MSLLKIQKSRNSKYKNVAIKIFLTRQFIAVKMGTYSRKNGYQMQIIAVKMGTYSRKNGYQSTFTNCLESLVNIAFGGNSEKSRI